MTNTASTDQVLKFMKIKYATLNRLMRAHPKPEAAGSGRWRGKPFPPAEKVGRDLAFDIKEVRAWCDANAEFYRRNKAQQTSIDLPLDSYLEFLRNYEPSPRGIEQFDDELNELEFDERDQYLLFNKAEIQGNTVKLSFDEVEDAVRFKLKYC